MAKDVACTKGLFQANPLGIVQAVSRTQNIKACTLCTYTLTRLLALYCCPHNVQLLRVAAAS
jgi:hypothetical protein